MFHTREALSVVCSGRRAGPAKLRAERGFAMLLMVFLLMLGVASVGITFYRPSPVAKLGADRTADVFAEVKAALIGYAARQGVFQCSNPANATACGNELAASSKLGEFPCPDLAGNGFAAASCATERLGRVPWKTLGISEPKDSAGETLWYAVSFRFLNNASNPIVKATVQTPSGPGLFTSSGAINSSTPGDVEIKAAEGPSITTTAVAVIFSPGTALGAQRRSADVVAKCAATNTNILESLCPSNYLDTFAGTSNAAAGGPFIMGTPGGGFNDRLVYVSAADVMPTLETRVAREMQALLIKYKYNSTCQCYPWADSWAYSGGIGDTGVNRGRLASKAEPDDWGSGTIPDFPAWVKDNDWHNHLYYSASNRETDNAGNGCLTCSAKPDLLVKRSTVAGDPVDTAAVVLITPGTSRPGKIRPYFPAVTLSHPLRDTFDAYFEDADNNNKASCPGNDTEHASSPSSFTKTTADDACDTFIRPQSKAYDRDRLWVIPPETLQNMCAQVGAALVNNAPCKDPNNSSRSRAVCVNMANKLKQCSAACASAAQVMIDPPCRNDTSSSQCPPARAALLTCSPA